MQAGKKKVIFREAPEEVIAELERVISKHFGGRAARESLEGALVIVSEAERREVFIASKGQYEVFMALKDVGREPYFIGLFAGIVRPRGRSGVQIQPSLDLFEKLFSRYKVNAIVVTEKAMENILYGRDLLREGVDRVLEPIGEYPLLVSQKLEPIALGKLKIPPHRWSRTRKTVVVAKNIVDKGWYLRGGG